MQHKRRIKLIKPRLQIKLTLIFMGFSARALLLQYLLLTSSLTSAALRLPSDSALMLREISSVLLRSIAISFALFMPPIVMIGILTTFRVAGPVFVFHRFLKNIREGRDPGVMRLRKGDKLKDLAEALNATYASIKERESETTEGSNQTQGQGEAQAA